MAATDEPVRQRAAQQETGHSRDLERPPLPEPLRTPVIDTHCHIDIHDGDAGAEWLGVGEALARAASVGVTRVVQVGCDLPSARWSVVAAHEHEHLVATVALHPNEAPRIEAASGRAALEEGWAEIESLAADPRVRAVGETGLDFFRTGEEGRATQEESFRRHIDLAKRLGKPVVIHDRDAHDDVIRVLESEGAPEHVVFHCYSGDAEMARYCTERGWFLSFAGTVTFKNAKVLREAAAVAPLANLLVETDAPYLTPTPYRGRPNASYLVPHTVRAMAEAGGHDEDVLAQALWDNAQRVFGPW
ncbi:TatD family hydrolase [Longivirga aurantiaca]|uniref:TatD family hydrolase n=1 Tax=Longivirga aurantiaca TaxID=1837743 RepID=A0ABW1SWH7_9ACTN